MGTRALNPHELINYYIVFANAWRKIDKMTLQFIHVFFYCVFKNYNLSGLLVDE